MTKFTYVELFAGIGGVTFGFDAVGGNCVMASEIDKYATQAYKALHRGVDLRGDVTKINAEDVPTHDVLSFTSPCQSFSIAGKRKGFEDTRGTLTFEALRIAKEKQPKALFMENVKGLVNHDGGNTLDTIILAMNDIGYTVDFNVLNSKYFGVAQSRERLFIVAVRDDLVMPKSWVIEGSSVVSKARHRLREQSVRSFNFKWPEQLEVTTKLRDVIEKQVDEKYYISREKVTNVVAKLSENNSDIKKIGWITKDRDQRRIHSIDGIMPTITANNQGGRSPGGFIADKETEEMMAIRSTDVADTSKYRIRKLVPLECFRIQGFSDDAHQTLEEIGLSDSQRYKQAGNAVTVNVIKAIGERLIPYISDAMKTEVSGGDSE